MFKLPSLVSVCPVGSGRIVERGETSWGAHVPDLPGCIAVGETRSEVVRLIREAVEFHIQELADSDQPIPRPTSEGDFIDVDAALE